MTELKIALAFYYVARLEKIDHSKRMIYRQAILSLSSENPKDLPFLKNVIGLRTRCFDERVLQMIIKSFVQKGRSTADHLTKEYFIHEFSSSSEKLKDPDRLEIIIDYAIEKGYLSEKPQYSNCWALRKASSEFS